jgi:hypothetical protein
MRDDLLDAQAAIEWAIPQIPLLQEALFGWTKAHRYELRIEPYSGLGGGNALVAYQPASLPRIFNAWAGAIINSLRSSLDLLAAALAARNGVKPSADTHFPIFGSDQEMIDPVTGIEGKKWLSKRERAAIKALKPYEGGDYAIWPLHQLDIRRKHERLIFANVDPSGFYWERGRPGGEHGFFMTGGLMPLQRSENKTILAMIPAHVLPAPEGDEHITAHVTFNEVALGLTDQEVTATLHRFSDRVREILGEFN